MPLKVFFYSDSKVVLAWIQRDPIKLNPYVANRITKIQNLTNKCSWLYIDSKNNPADYISKGISPHQIKNMDSCFKGTDDLSKTEFSHNSQLEITDPFPLPELKVNVMVQQICIEPLFFEKYSYFNKLQRIVAYILREADGQGVTMCIDMYHKI